jgi:thioesterase domain-containing protein
MSASSTSSLTQNTHALFARVSRSSELVIIPINDCALDKDGERPAFYCVHSVSGVVGSDFLALAQCLEPTIRFYGIQAPPKRMLDPDFGRSVEAMADHYSKALDEFQPRGPIALGGYCVGAIIALAMAEKLRASGRDVGPLIVIDGAPENTGIALRRWKLRYWADLIGNVPGWVVHGDLMRNRTLRSLIWSLSNNASAIGKSAIGLRRGEKLGGGYAIDGIMDVSRYPPEHKSFVDRLFAALFQYVPRKYSGEVVVYEAKITPLLYLPLIGRTWARFAPQSHMVRVLGTHISMMRAPYVDALAKDLRRRLAEFFSSRAADLASVKT